MLNRQQAEFNRVVKVNKYYNFSIPMILLTVAGEKIFKISPLIFSNKFFMSDTNDFIY